MTIGGKTLQVLDGLMLGDGSTQRYHNTALYRMSQSKHTISIEDHLKWLYWLRDNVFITLDIEAVVCPYWTTYSYKTKKEKRQIASLRTGCSPLLVPFHDEWHTGGEWVIRKGFEHRSTSYYVHGELKVLPDRLRGSVVLPILTLVHWFLGDGGSRWRLMKNRTPLIVSEFSTHGFAADEVYHLMSMLGNMGVKTVKPARAPHRSGSGLRICLSQEGIDDLADLVEPHIMEIFGDSVGPSYKDMIKYKSADRAQTRADFNILRRKLACTGVSESSERTRYRQ